MLLRKLEAGLIGISHVVVDEIHERDINVCEDWSHDPRITLLPFSSQGLVSFFCNFSDWWAHVI